MSALMYERASGAHLSAKCPCGRVLRARLDQAGSAITCWDCHASVRVPIPAAPGDWVARLLKVGARQLVDARTCTLLAFGAILVTAGMLAPGPGKRRGRPRARPDDDRLWRTPPEGEPGRLDGTARRRGRREGLAGIALPGGGRGARPPADPRGRQGGRTEGHPGRARGRGAADRDAPGPHARDLWPRRDAPRAGGRGRRHGRTPPDGRAGRRSCSCRSRSSGSRSCSSVATRIGGTFAFMDARPLPQAPGRRGGLRRPLPRQGSNFRLNADPSLLHVYVDAVRRGYTLIGAIPASLALGVSNGYDTTSIYINPNAYRTLRILFTLVIATGMLAALAVQARWLGLLATMDSRRTAV